MSITPPLPTAESLTDEQLQVYMDRFMKYVEKTETCWLWKGCVNTNGYGAFKFCGRMLNSHRAMFNMVTKESSNGRIVCHTCDNPLCVNPDHLFYGTQKDNVRDMIAKGRDRPWGRYVTHCPHGHEYTLENTLIVGKIKQRRCKACNLLRCKKYRSKKRANLIAP